MSRPLLIALGAGLQHRQLSDPPRAWIGDQTRLRAEAAATVWKRNPESLIVFSGGLSHDSPTEADAMKDYVMHSPLNIPASAILTETTSIDTASNVRNIVALIRERSLPTDNIVLIAGRRHILRATRYFAAYGIHVRPHIVSDILDVKPEYVFPHDRFKEFLLLIAQIVDRKGIIPRLIRERQRRNR